MTLTLVPPLRRQSPTPREHARASAAQSAHATPGWATVACDVDGCSWNTMRPDRPDYLRSALLAHRIDKHRPRLTPC